jgi:DNA processing protein
LDALADPPDRLWAYGHGSLTALTERAVGVIGSRASTEYGNFAASQLAYDLSGQGVTVVSGGGFGIDATAHRAALAAETATVVVSASGLNRSYPPAHAGLFERIARQGVVLSAADPDAPVRRPQFLVRNQLMAALSQAVVVVEAARHSGSLGLAQFARSLGRPVFAVPGPITSSTSTGCHQLLRDGQAQLCSSAADVLDALDEQA